MRLGSRGLKAAVLVACAEDFARAGAFAGFAGDLVFVLALRAATAHSNKALRLASLER
jgi:hypothetical protein